MRYRPRIVCLEGPQNLERRREDSDNAIMGSEEEILRPRAYTAYFVGFQERPGLVIGSFDLANFEEIERFPLSFVSDEFAP